MHTMKYEHFGIAIVELMSSGIITVAHNSAGPKLDIIGGAKKEVGYLADDLEGYTFFVHKALIEFDTDKMKQLRIDAREWVRERFGLSAFNKQFF